MSAIAAEIKTIESEIHECFDNDSPIDPKKVKRLQELRLDRLRELVSTHDQRLEVMKQKTRELTAKMASLNFDHKPDLKERIWSEQDKYDKAATRWVISESCFWEESEAYSIAVGILILINEIH